MSVMSIRTIRPSKPQMFAVSDERVGFRHQRSKIVSCRTGQRKALGPKRRPLTLLRLLPEASKDGSALICSMMLLIASGMV